MSAATIKKFAAISKVEDNDDGTITVYGVASTEAVDAHGETVTKAAMENALPDYMKYGTGALRAMHQPIAAGTVNKATVNDNGETEIEATVVDPVEITKVKTGVYKGFSIGGSQVPGGYDKLTKTITALKLTEISLVDRPANPESVIQMWKFEDEPTATVNVTPEAAAAVEALAELLNKSEISPARLVELATAEIAKAAKSDDDATGTSAPDADGSTSADGKGEGADDKDTKKSVTVGAIRKGMYSVSNFADLLCSLSWLVSNSQSEEAWEGDDSTVPSQLLDWLTEGGKIFQNMAAEEIAEMIASLQPEGAVSVDVIELSEQATTLRKSLDDAAAAGSLAGYLAITKAHMPENDVAALVLAEGYEKATTAVLARLAPESDAIAKLADATAKITKLETERDELAAKVAKFEALPAPSKATLRVVVEKGVDVPNTGAQTVTDEPIKKADGTIDHEATAVAAIKKVHQSGGTALRQSTN